MRKHLVMTLVGPDHIGIVDRVTKKILEFHGNVEESRMARLGGEFSMLLLISVTEGKREALIEALNKLQDENFQVFIRETESKTATKYSGWLPYRVVVSGADNEGIINSISHHLAESGINVESAETNTAAAPMTGTLLFSMTAIVLVPPTLSYHGWREPLDEVGDRMNVSIEVSPYAG